MKMATDCWPKSLKIPENLDPGTDPGVDPGRYVLRGSVKFLRPVLGFGSPSIYFAFLALSLRLTSLVQTYTRVQPFLISSKWQKSMLPVKRRAKRLLDGWRDVQIPTNNLFGLASQSNKLCSSDIEIFLKVCPSH